MEFFLDEESFVFKRFWFLVRECELLSILVIVDLSLMVTPLRDEIFLVLDGSDVFALHPIEDNNWWDKSNQEQSDVEFKRDSSGSGKHSYGKYKNETYKRENDEGFY